MFVGGDSHHIYFFVSPNRRRSPTIYDSPHQPEKDIRYLPTSFFSLLQPHNKHLLHPHNENIISMCWYEEYDEPTTSIRIVQRRRVYREIPSSPKHSYSSYCVYAKSPSPSPSPSPSRKSRSSYTTITTTRRHIRTYDVISVRYETERAVRLYIPDHGGRRDDEYRAMNVRIIDRKP